MKSEPWLPAQVGPSPGTELWASDFTEFPSPEGGCPALACPFLWLAWIPNEIMTVKIP